MKNKKLLLFVVVAVVIDILLVVYFHFPSLLTLRAPVSFETEDLDLKTPLESSAIWPMFRYNARHTGRCPYDTSKNNEDLCAGRLY